jgi:hypothetical protein
MWFGINLSDVDCFLLPTLLLRPESQADAEWAATNNVLNPHVALTAEKGHTKRLTHSNNIDYGVEGEQVPVHD